MSAEKSRTENPAEDQNREPSFLLNLLRLPPYPLRSPTGLHNHQPPYVVATSTLLMPLLPPRPSIDKLMSLPTYFLKHHSIGFEAYLVGGCVRHLLVNRTPKDFDIITTADLNQVSFLKTTLFL
ncbi:unnamed protein product [Lactuca saligna]|uniref:Poly A polymerase head domain-containing protein n=1 Tax=Lactuca saligna TaxID=75948 RepID=A0AA36DYH6_LACSI|nr:unnamed protein product [Lactuca saligna]